MCEPGSEHDKNHHNQASEWKSSNMRDVNLTISSSALFHPKATTKSPVKSAGFCLSILYALHYVLLQFGVFQNKRAFA